MKKLIIAAITTLTIQAQATLLIGTINGLVNSVVITIAAPFLATTGTTIAATEGREEVLKAVKADAYDFLATGEKSEALSAVLVALESEIDELSGKSDIELASVIVVGIE